MNDPKHTTMMKRMGVLLGVVLVGAGAAQAAMTTLLSYDFESVAPTSLFIISEGAGGVISNATMATLGASNAVYETTDDSFPWGSWTGIGQASGVVAGLNSTNSYAVFEAREKASNGSTVVAALNALSPGTYYLRISYDENRLNSSTFKVGVVIKGSNGGTAQDQRGEPGTPGFFGGIDRWYGGVPCIDPDFDNAFIKCFAEHERNVKTSNPYPWRIQVVPASATPGDLNVFKQGSFTELDVIVLRDQTGDTYIDNLVIEYQKVDGSEPIYLDDLLRTTIITSSSTYSSTYLDYPVTTAPGDGMIEYLHWISADAAPYTRAGDVTIDVAPYRNSESAAGYFGSGVHGYRFTGWTGYNRFHPLWVKGDGQTSPTNTVATWTQRDQGQASHGFGCWANQLITFDVDAIRSYLLGGTGNPLRLAGSFGMLGENTSDSDTAIGGIWVDGVNRFISTTKTRDDASDSFELRLSPSDRYLTLAFLNDSAWNESNAVFKDVTLVVLPMGTLVAIK